VSRPGPAPEGTYGRARVAAFCSSLRGCPGRRLWIGEPGSLVGPRGIMPAERPGSRLGRYCWTERTGLRHDISSRSGH
jgi:hypothetical protein